MENFIETSISLDFRGRIRNIKFEKREGSL